MPLSTPPPNEYHAVDKVPLAGRVLTIMLSMVAMAALSACLIRRLETIRRWRRLPITSWVCLLIYADSVAFVFLTAVLRYGTGITVTVGYCDGAIVLCLGSYVSTKILIYFFLVEKAYIVSGSTRRRLEDKVYLLNIFFMLVPYSAIVIINFIFRFAYINENGECIIGMKRLAMIPLISFDVVVNVYLTILFVLPLRRLYSYKNKVRSSSLRTITIRTFFGSCATLISSVVNLTVLMVLKGERGWVCLMCCNADVLFSVLVLHWVTAIDRQSETATVAPGAYGIGSTYGPYGPGTVQRSRHNSVAGTPVTMRSFRQGSVIPASSRADGLPFTFDAFDMRMKRISETISIEEGPPIEIKDEIETTSIISASPLKKTVRMVEVRQVNTASTDATMDTEVSLAETSLDEMSSSQVIAEAETSTTCLRPPSLSEEEPVETEKMV